MKDWLKSKWTNFLWWLAFGLLLSLSGCSNAKWHADNRFTTEERAAIIEGFNWLESHAGFDFGGIDFDYEVTGDQNLPATIRRGHIMIPVEGQPDQIASACVEGKTVYLAAGETKLEHLPGLTAHELAHCILMFEDRYHGNEEKSEGIMRVLTPMRWTESEEEQFKSRGFKREGK